MRLEGAYSVLDRGWHDRNLQRDVPDRYHYRAGSLSPNCNISSAPPDTDREATLALSLGPFGPPTICQLQKFGEGGGESYKITEKYPLQRFETASDEKQRLVQI